MCFQPNVKKINCEFTIIHPLCQAFFQASVKVVLCEVSTMLPVSTTAARYPGGCLKTARGTGTESIVLSSVLFHWSLWLPLNVYFSQDSVILTQLHSSANTVIAFYTSV